MVCLNGSQLRHKVMHCLSFLPITHLKVQICVKERRFQIIINCVSDKEVHEGHAKVKKHFYLSLRLVLLMTHVYFA